MPKVKIILENNSVYSQGQSRILASFLRQAIKRKLKKNEASCELFFFNSGKVAELNFRYRGKKETTDVLSFPIWKSLEEIKSRNHPISLGTIVINGELLAEIAPQKRKFTAEKLALHGLNHLLGYHHD